MDEFNFGRSIGGRRCWGTARELEDGNFRVHICFDWLPTIEEVILPRAEIFPFFDEKVAEWEVIARERYERWRGKVKS